MKDAVKNAVRVAFARLLQEDGGLFDCPIEEEFPYDARKLHEVCINHKLANHLEEVILPLVAAEERMFVDIEFNREGLNYKLVQMDGEQKRLRPDIIVHNRRSGSTKRNFLVVECKKEGSSQTEIEEDQRKICAMMEDERYKYSFGLQVVYGRRQIEGSLFYRNADDTGDDTGIVAERITANETMQPARHTRG
jgi:hypothetical protein